MFGKLRKEIKTKFFWKATIVSVIIAIAAAYGQQNKDFFYLQFPLGVIVIAMLPAMTASAISIDFSILFVKFHIKCHKWFARISKRENQTTYSISDKFSINTSTKHFAIVNTWHSIGTVFLIFRGIGVDKLNSFDITLLSAGFIFLALILFSGLNVSIYLIKKRGIIFEDNKNGTRINLGKQLESTINSMISPIQIILFIYTIPVGPSITAFLGIVIASLIICFPSSIFSFWIMRRKHMDKMMIKMSRKLSKFVQFV